MALAYDPSPAQLRRVQAVVVRRLTLLNLAISVNVNHLSASSFTSERASQNAGIETEGMDKKCLEN